MLAKLKCLIVLFSLATASLSLAPGALAQQWIAPTPEELAMTSIKEVPGAAAVYLDRDETTDDALHMHSFYYRVKVLTEKGKDYANVELPFYAGEGGEEIDQIEGRTIHPDGTIVPFTGKPYDKFVAKAGDMKVKEKVFTLPSVDVGSIIEYRYKLRLDDNYYQEPQWYIQTDLYTRKAHFLWRPTDRMLFDEKGNFASGRVAWAPILPPGAQIKQTLMANKMQLELDVHDIPPQPVEEYMPPMQSVSYRVQFYYTIYNSVQDYWKSTGKQWSKNVNKIAEPNRKVAEYANSLVLPTDTDDQKARKLYAAVMAMENMDFTREHTRQEDKVGGLREVKSAEDIVQRQRGDSDQLTELFVAMARAVGLKAYVMGVADRNERLFVPMYLSLRQIDADVAIVAIGGKEVFFDPGQRYCEPEHLSWRHAVTRGIRQTDGGTEIASTPTESYKTAHTTRIADLKLDEHGEAEGTVTLTFQGDPALRWRQLALTGDETALNEELKSSMEKMLPGGMEVKVAGIENLKEYEKPLKVKYEVKGAVGSSTGRRLLLPVDVFEVNEKPWFPEAKREIPVDMHYAYDVQDAVRFKLPDALAVESTPEPAVEKMLTLAAFDAKVARTPNSVTTFRNLIVGDAIFLPKEYDDLKSFYGKLAAKDQETIVLTHAAVAPVVQGAATKPTGN